jgi:2-keto-4-pentenoate hydratase/2-oxohepta-3-ene-1,7-dioic acid hydratase in catechol pathway
MRWCSFGSAGDDVQAGLVVDDTVHGVGRALIEIIGSPDALAAARQEAMSAPTEVLPLADADLRASIPVPPSIRDFMAFEEHVVTSYQALGQQVHPDWYQLPVFYFTNPAAVHGPREDVRISPLSSAFDYELEIAAVIGVPGRDIPAADAEAHIAGYTILCDWSARDLQEREMRLSLGPAKGKDSATSLGPLLVTPDELEPFRAGNAYDLSMTATVDGRVYSRGNFSTIYWSFGALIEYASRGTELRTGDVIGSGTVGTGCILELSRVHGSDAYPWLAPGDVVELAVDQLGTIRSTIVSPTPGR